jgi:glycosyltransferase involved in cell wall biosynthesis
MGSFPVQATGSCGREITPDGRGAIFVPATDTDAVTAAMRRALTDDELVDTAAEINARAAAEHLDRRRTRARVLDAYERIVCDAALTRAG